LVFDAGQNSADNFDLFDVDETTGEKGSPLHFVGSLPPSDHPDLLAVPKKRYTPVDPQTFPGLTGFETTKTVFGVERRVVVTHSPNLHAKQTAGFDQTIAKALRQLAAVEARLARGKCRKTREKVEAEIAEILKARWLPRVITTTLAGDTPAGLRLSYQVDRRARTALEKELFGKRILFTDNQADTTPTSRVVADYRSQEAVEADFRQMKDPKIVSFSPMFHWTEQKIRVHVFYCVLALMTARLMVREADRRGVHMSVRVLLDTLADIQETVLVYQGERGRPRARRMLTETDPTARRLYDIFGLDAYAPNQP
jgi:transposase